MHRTHRQSAVVAGALSLVGLLSWPATGLAQTTVTGQAAAAQVVVLGLLGTATTSTLAGTGISGTNAESDVGQDAGSIASLLSAEAIDTATYSYLDQVDSEASLGNLALTVAGVSLTADSVVAAASQVYGGAGS